MIERCTYSTAAQTWCGCCLSVIVPQEPSSLLVRGAVTCTTYKLAHRSSFSPHFSPSLPPPFSPPLMSRSDSSLHSLPDIRDSVHGVHLTSPVSGQSACPLDLGQVPHGPSSLLPHGQRHQTSGERDLRPLYAAACLSNLKL